MKILMLVCCVYCCLLLTGCEIEVERPATTKEEMREAIYSRRWMGTVGRERYMILLMEEMNEKLDKIVSKDEI